MSLSRQGHTHYPQQQYGHGPLDQTNGETNVQSEPPVYTDLYLIEPTGPAVQENSTSFNSNHGVSLPTSQNLAPDFGIYQSGSHNLELVPRPGSGHRPLVNTRQMGSQAPGFSASACPTNSTNSLPNNYPSSPTQGLMRPQQGAPTSSQQVMSTDDEVQPGFFDLLNFNPASSSSATQTASRHTQLPTRAQNDLAPGFAHDMQPTTITPGVPSVQPMQTLLTPLPPGSGAGASQASSSGPTPLSGELEPFLYDMMPSVQNPGAYSQSAQGGSSRPRKRKARMSPDVEETAEAEAGGLAQGPEEVEVALAAPRTKKARTDGQKKASREQAQQYRCDTNRHIETIQEWYQRRHPKQATKLTKIECLKEAAGFFSKNPLLPEEVNELRRQDQLEIQRLRNHIKVLEKVLHAARHGQITTQNHERENTKAAQ
ncbi:hypothetical protein DENSPDRAFT_870224 [Dentipellis sp. KUC8613]|nr:hypothetical protein DENSPDRAFT_870224 [Dentipellis sp. KUC8613]